MTRAAAAVEWNATDKLCLDDSLKSDPEIVFAAVGENGFALKFADRELMGEREIVRVAVKTHAPAENFAAEYDEEELERALNVHHTGIQ